MNEDWEIKKVHIVKTGDQMTDIMTIEMKTPENFTLLLKKGEILPNCSCC